MLVFFFFVPITLASVQEGWVNINEVCMTAKARQRHPATRRAVERKARGREKWARFLGAAMWTKYITRFDSPVKQEMCSHPVKWLKVVLVLLQPSERLERLVLRKAVCCG